MLWFGWTGTAGGMWSPTPTRVVQAMLAQAQLKPGNTLYDLGAGDGRVIIGAGRLGAYAVGVEIDPLRCWLIRLRIRLLGLGPQVRVEKANFFHLNYSTADVVCVYLSQGAVNSLAEKLSRELPPTARVLSYRRALPGWALLSHDGANQIYCYALPAKGTRAASS